MLDSFVFQGSGDISQVDAYDAGRGSSPDDDLELSTILVRPVDTSAGAESSSGSADWLTTLPPGEASRAICLVSVGPETTRFVDPHCRGYAVVATSSRLLRIFAQPAPSAASSGNALRLLQVGRILAVSSHLSSSASSPRPPRSLSSSSYNCRCTRVRLSCLEAAPRLESTGGSALLVLPYPGV